MVGSAGRLCRPGAGRFRGLLDGLVGWLSWLSDWVHLTVWCGIQDLYIEETRVFQAGIRLEYISMGKPAEFRHIRG